MQKYLKISDINPFKRALASLSIITKQRYKQYKDLSNIRSQEALFDHYISGEYADNLSYAYRLFDCEKEKSIFQFQPYTDCDIGGSSKGELKFNLEKNCLQMDGFIDATDKDKLEHHPSIGFARTHPYPLNCGPFNAIQVELQSDGEPIHVGVELQSPIQGLLSCYGIITSKVKTWQCYQLPIHNMMVVGAENGPRGTNNYEMKDNSTVFFDREAYDARRVLMTESKHAIIRDINIRLLGSKSAHRRVFLRSVNLIRRAHSRKLIEEYRQPFFFIVQPDPYVFNPEMGVSWLTKGYNDMKQMDYIDLGDKVYKKSGSHNYKRKH